MRWLWSRFPGWHTSQFFNCIGTTLEQHWDNIGTTLGNSNRTSARRIWVDEHRRICLRLSRVRGKHVSELYAHIYRFLDVCLRAFFPLMKNICLQFFIRLCCNTENSISVLHNPTMLTIQYESKTKIYSLPFPIFLHNLFCCLFRQFIKSFWIVL